MSTFSIIFWGVIVGSMIGLMIWRHRLDKQLRKLQDDLANLVAAGSALAATMTTTTAGGWATSSSISMSTIIRQEYDELPPEPESFWTPEPILAWRQFRLDSRTLKLGALTRPTLYIPGRPATCDAGLISVMTPHDTPMWACTCGYYATKYPFSNWGDRHGNGEPVVNAAVLLSGIVIEHGHGYRAQYMELFAIDPSGSLAAPNAFVADDTEAVLLEYSKRKENYEHR